MKTRWTRRVLRSLILGLSGIIRHFTKLGAASLEGELKALTEIRRLSITDDILEFFEERKNIPLTEVVRLAKEPPFDNAYLSRPEVHKFGTEHYGYSYLLAEYAGLGPYFQPSVAIEHGINLRDREHVVADDEVDFRYHTLFCAGLERRQMFESVFADGQIVEAIGPYIAYAKPLLDGQNFKRLKEQIGRTLVVFPSHSTENTQVDFDSNVLFREIDKIHQEGKYKTVWICLHFSDVLKGRAAEYLTAGYTCVTAGHRNDIHFLSRLRSIIELADMTMSNDFFTGLGYCTYLNRPHYMALSKIERSNTKGDDLNKGEVSNQQVIESFHPVFRRLFGEFTEAVTEEQRLFGEKYFGFSQVKSPAQMKQLLLDAKARSDSSFGGQE